MGFKNHCLCFGIFLFLLVGCLPNATLQLGPQLDAPTPAASGPHAEKAGLRAVTPGVVIAQSLPELLQIMNAEKPHGTAAAGFRTQSIPSPGELAPSHVSLAPLPNGHMAITLKTRSYVTYLAIGGVAYYIHAAHPDYPPSFIDGIWVVGGALSEEVELLFYWDLIYPLNV